MSEHCHLKSTCETGFKKLIVIQGSMNLIVFAVLIISFVVSRIFLQVFESPAFFHYSALWILIAGLPLLGHQLKKARELDEEIVTSLIQGVKQEKGHQKRPYFRDAIRSYRSERKFVVRLICILGLVGLILAWSGTILKASGASETDYLSNMRVSSALMGIFAMYVIVYGSASYRRLLRELKNISEVEKASLSGR